MAATHNDHQLHRVRFELDEDAVNPRKDYDHVTKMVCWHSRYNLGDEHSFDNPNHMISDLLGEYGMSDDDARALCLAIVKSDKYGPSDYRSWIDGWMGSYDSIHDCRREFVCEMIRQGYNPPEAMGVIENNFYILPLHLYDHSGLTMSTGRFSCPWDSGQVGWIYISKSSAAHNFGGYDNLDKRAIDILEAEVAEYDCYLRGSVYGFIHEVAEADDDTDPDDLVWDDVDSCWGFYDSGTDQDMIDHIVEHVGEELRQAVTDGWHNRFV